MDRPLTCLSCANYRTAGCAEHHPGWPRAVSSECWFFVYEPGSDEGIEDE
jgi:hypothetical protein